MNITQRRPYSGEVIDDSGRIIAEITGTPEAILAIDRALLVASALTEWAHNFNLDEIVEMAEHSGSNAELLRVVKQARQVNARPKGCAHCEDPEAHE